MHCCQHFGVIGSKQDRSYGAGLALVLDFDSAGFARPSADPNTIEILGPSLSILATATPDADGPLSLIAVLERVPR